MSFEGKQGFCDNIRANLRFLVHGETDLDLFTAIIIMSTKCVQVRCRMKFTIVGFPKSTA